MIREALRVPGYCAHVANPQPPLVLHGDPFSYEGKLTHAAQHAKRNYMLNGKPVSRKLRKNENVLLSGVASFPKEFAEDSPSFWVYAKQLILDKIKHDYGSHLVAVMEHLDEENPHIHYWVQVEDFNMALVCPVMRAHASVDRKSTKASGKARKAAGMAALIAFQDDWFTVFQKCGLSRTGPRRRRMTRAAWKVEKMMLDNHKELSVSKMKSDALFKGVAGAMLGARIGYDRELAQLREMNMLLRSQAPLGLNKALEGLFDSPTLS